MPEILLVFVVMPFILTFISGVAMFQSLLACGLLIAISILMFYFYYRKPKTSEWVSVIVLSILAVVLRCAFVMAEQFKPIAGVVIIAGLATGPVGGLLTGMLSGFFSSFFFGYGAWVPAQMYVFGLGGFLFGLLSKKMPKIWERNVLVSILSGLYIVFIGGPILDIWSIGFSMDAGKIIMTLKSGLPFNCIHGLAVMLTVYFLCIPICKKMNRLRTRYGVMEEAFSYEV